MAFSPASAPPTPHRALPPNHPISDRRCIFDPYSFVFFVLYRSIVASLRLLDQFCFAPVVVSRDLVAICVETLGSSVFLCTFGCFDLGLEFLVLGFVFFFLVAGGAVMDKKKVAVPLVCHGHSRPVVDLHYSPVTPDGFFLISASKDCRPMLRNGETGDWIGTFEGHKGAVWSCCLDTSALRAASGSADFSAKIWDALTGDELHSFDHKHIVRACAFSEDTHMLLTGGLEKLLRIYDLNRPDASPQEVDKSPGSVRTVAWMHSDQTILSSCTDSGGVRLWDLRNGMVVQTLETKSPVTSAEVSQDGRYITTCDGTSVKFWDANHFGLVKSYTMAYPVESASLEPKAGNKFVAGGEDMWVRLFDFHTGEEIACNKGHHGPVHCVRFSPGGESYASGSEDGTIRIWQTVQDEVESLPASNGLSKVKVNADDVARKIEGFHIAAKEGQPEEENVGISEG